MHIKLSKFIFVTITTVLLLLAGIAPSLVNALPQSIPHTNTIHDVEPVLVTFGDSLEIQSAVQNFLINFPRSKTIDFIHANEIIQFTSNPVVYIGHSSINGIGYYNDLVSWNTISKLISSSKSNNHYILGCNSQMISQLTEETGKNVESFVYEIDALMGVAYISMQIALIEQLSLKNVMQFMMQYFMRSLELKENPDLALFMGFGGGEDTSPRFGGEETYTIGVIGIVIAAALFPCTTAIVAISIGVMVTGLLIVSWQLYELIRTIIDYINGESVNLASVLSYMWTLITTLASMYVTAINALVWWRAGAAWVCFAADTTSAAVATVAKVIILSAALAVVMSSMILFVYDYMDHDLTFW